MGSESEKVARSTIVARWFDVDPGHDPYRLRTHPGFAAHDDDPDPLRKIEIRAGQIILITGPSGAGKSTLLRELRAQNGDTRWIDLSRVRLPDRPVVDCMTDRLPPRADDDDESRIVAALDLLSRVGLGEVWTYLRRPFELSEGQRWRLRLALAIAAATRAAGRPTALVADEFCALLDRITAAIVARALRKTVDSSGQPVCAVVATSHDDLVAALRPDLHAVCDFGRVTVSSK